MKRMAWVIIYIFILLFGQVLFAAPSFAEDCTADADCGENAKCESGFCVSADSSITPADAGAGSSAGSAAAGGGAEFSESGVDQRCWKKQDCEQTGFGKFIGPNVETKEACKMEKDGANNQIGFCLPTKQAQMGLNWGEAGGQKSTYTHIGEFIQWIYRYGIVVAGILAVVMIIKAGFDWIISGGNQEMITGAHKKIGNALMGLFLAVMAYFILNLINPYLVNFRLPNIWMINTAGLVPPYCDGIKDKEFYFAKLAADKDYINTYAVAMQNGFKKYNEIKTECGKEYYVEGSNGLTCGGTVCDKIDNNVATCIPNTGKTKYECTKGNIAGRIKYTPIVTPDCFTVLKQWEGWQKPAADISKTELWAVCSNGDWKDVSSLIKGQDIDSDTQIFALGVNFNEIEEVKNQCESDGFKFKGMVLMLEMAEECDMTDEEHLIGKIGFKGVDLGDEGHTDKKDNTAISGGAKYGTANIGLMNDKYFITADELKEGVFVDIGATDVHDIDEDADRSVYEYLTSS